ncbi:MAG: formate/nitrite transporter family protein [Ruminococcaceae bacterium]|nr:formate/nitrite transporter family protein [Oscillospiraceae bacterium]
MNNFKVLVSSILAGTCIGFGGVIYLMSENKVIGAMFFAIGLLTICSYGLHLYTGKVCYVFQNDKKFALQIPIIWFGNLIGTGIIALISMATRNGAKLAAAAQGLCDVKTADSYISLFMLGIFCNIMIYIAVEGYNKIQFEMGKYLSLFLGVMVFILSGFEHSIADMFYFWMCMNWSVESVIRLIVITLGNAVGGIVFAEVKRYVCTK